MIFFDAKIIFLYDKITDFSILIIIYLINIRIIELFSVAVI